MKVSKNGKHILEDTYSLISTEILYDFSVASYYHELNFPFIIVYLI